MTFSAQSPDLPRLNLGRESFAFLCTLALFGVAFYPISVRRLADSLAASFSAILTNGNQFALRFAWVATTNFPEDFHLISHRPCWAYIRSECAAFANPQISRLLQRTLGSGRTNGRRHNLYEAIELCPHARKLLGRILFDTDLPIDDAASGVENHERWKCERITPRQWRLRVCERIHQRVVGKRHGDMDPGARKCRDDVSAVLIIRKNHNARAALPAL